MQRLRDIRAYREQLRREQAEAAGEGEEPAEPGTRRPRVIVETPFLEDDTQL
jgi:hypothetical protein